MTYEATTYEATTIDQSATAAAEAVAAVSEVKTRVKKTLPEKIEALENRIAADTLKLEELVSERDNAERLSGVWAVHIGTGKTIAFLKFTGGVQEIFAVQAIAGVLFPEIVHEGDLMVNTYSLPDSVMAEVAAPRAMPGRSAAEGGKS